jgi:hypothetical protein
VLSYSRGQQLNLLKNIGFKSPSWEDLTLLLIGVLSAFALGGAAWAWYDRHRTDPWTRQMDQLRRSLQSIGVDAAPHEPPRTLASRLRSRLGPRAGTLTALLDALERQRYARGGAMRPDTGLTRRFKAEARRLHTAPQG